MSSTPSQPELAFALKLVLAFELALALAHDRALAFELAVDLARSLAFELALAPELYSCPMSICLMPCSVPCWDFLILPLTCQVPSCCSGLYNLVTCCLKTH